MRALFLVVLLVTAPRTARADVVGILDPELASICGGSAHNPNCGSTEVGAVCCGATVLALGAIGAVLALRGRREKK